MKFEIKKNDDHHISVDVTNEDGQKIAEVNRKMIEEENNKMFSNSISILDSGVDQKNVVENLNKFLSTSEDEKIKKFSELDSKMSDTYIGYRTPYRGFINRFFETPFLVDEFERNMRHFDRPGMFLDDFVFPVNRLLNTFYNHDVGLLGDKNEKKSPKKQTIDSFNAHVQRLNRLKKDHEELIKGTSKRIDHITEEIKEYEELIENLKKGMEEMTSESK